MKLDLATGRLITVEQEELDRRIRAIRFILRQKKADLFMAVCPQKNGIGKWITGTDTSERASEGMVLIGRTGNVIIVKGGALIPRDGKSRHNYAMAAEYEGKGFKNYESCEGLSVELIENTMDSDKIAGKHSKNDNIKISWKKQPVHKTVAVDNMRYMRADVYEYLKKNFPGIGLLDVSAEMNELRARKSEAEIRIFEENVRMIDKVFAGAGIYINPMKYEQEIVTDLRYALYRLGCGGADYLLSAPIDMTSNGDNVPRTNEIFLYPGRRVEFGDRINLKMFALGNDGYYVGMARSFVLGKPCVKTKELWDITVQAQDYAVNFLRPGVQVKNVVKAVNIFLKNAGVVVSVCTIHGIGCSIWETPWAYEKRVKKNSKLQEDGKEEVEQVYDEKEIIVKDNMILYVGITVGDGIVEPVSCGDIYRIKKEKIVRVNEFAREIIRLY